MRHPRAAALAVLASMQVSGLTACAPSHPPAGAAPSAPPSKPQVTTEMKPAIAPTTYIRWHSTVTIEGLEIYVTSLEQKRDMDGHEVLQVGLRLRLRGEQHVTGFSGRDGDSPSEIWNGYKVELRGGSKESVGIAVTRVP